MRYSSLSPFQMSSLFLSKSWRFLGFRHSIVFFINHRFSVGFRSGEFAGKDGILNLWLIIYFWWLFLYEVFSYLHLEWIISYTWQLLSTLCWYFWLLIFPRLLIRRDFPLVLIAPQTMIPGSNFNILPIHSEWTYLWKYIHV